MKKAMELSILCGAEVGLVVMFDGKLHTYSSAPMEDIQSMYNNYEGRYESLTNDDVRIPNINFPNSTVLSIF